MNLTQRFVAFAPFATVLASAASAHASPPPSGSHPRLFLDDTVLAAFKANASKKDSAAASLVSQCQDTIDNPGDVAARGGDDADTWPGGAVRCAFSYLATNKPEHLKQAIMLWQAALDDDATLGDKLGCIQGVDADWEHDWNGQYPYPPVLETVSHDTGYPMRWYGPYLSLVYDWLYDAPGVDEPLRAQTRTCLNAWVDWYSANGYQRDMPGTNYNAAFVAAKTFAAVAIGTDGGADGHLWNETVGDLFPHVLIGNGTRWTPAGSSMQVTGGLVGQGQTTLGKPFGSMVGGDWGTWEYGPLSVMEYAAASAALEKQGEPLPAMDDWVNSLVTRYIYGTVPHADGMYCGEGDCGDCDPNTPGSCTVNAAPNAGPLDAVLLGASSDQAAAWALFMKQKQATQGTAIWNALGETRSVEPADFTAQKGVPLWYLARGTRSMYVRTSWKEDALWAVINSAPSILDHQHYGASSFVFSRGGDHLIIEPAPYGMPSTVETNGVTADSSVVTGNYAPSQTPWSEADLLWARGTTDGVYAARSDFAAAFDFAGTPSDVKYAHREWVLLPEGEVVTIDRTHTSAASRNMYISFHTNTGGGGLTLGSNGVASGKIGTSEVAIHPVLLSGGAPKIAAPPLGDCFDDQYPYGACEAVRVPVDKYSVVVPGAVATAVHVIDGLSAGEAQAEVGSLNDDNFDPPPKQNHEVIGAAVYREKKQSYVVASSAIDGKAGATITYGVPAGSPGRHVLFDAPENGAGESAISAKVAGERCVLTVEAGAGFTGHPLMFTVSSAADGCKVTDATDVSPGTAPPGGGVTGAGGGSSGSGVGGGNGGDADTSSASGGCGCLVAGEERAPSASLFGFAALALAAGFRSARRAKANVRQPD